MTKKQRLQEMKDYLIDHGELTVTEACEVFKASPATIRRDFNTLIQKGQVGKTWGGITKLEDQDTSTLTVAHRQTLFAHEKERIAEQAASYIQDGDIIIIDGGTTTFFMTKYIAHKRIRVITNSILIAYQIDKDRNKNYGAGAEVFVTGGLSYPDSGLLVGPQAISNIRQYHANTAFLSVGGIGSEQATNSNQLVVETERAIMEQSEKVIMLADHSKLGKRSMCEICNISDIDVLITNFNEEKQNMISRIRQAGVEVIEVADR